MRLAQEFSSLFGRYIFSIAIAANMFSMTALLIVLSFLGYPEMAAEMGVVQGATLAVFLAFSANARNLVLSGKSNSLLRELFFLRVILLLPLSAAAYFLSKGIMDSFGAITTILILRRCMEWIAELQISERESKRDLVYANLFVLIQGIVFTAAVLSLEFGGKELFQAVLVVWAVTPFLLGVRFASRMFAQKPEGWFALTRLVPHVGSSWIIGVSTYLFRVVIVLVAGRAVGGLLFSAYAIGGMLNSIYTYALGPSLALEEEKTGKTRIKKLTNYVVWGLFVSGAALLTFAEVSAPGEEKFFINAIGFSLFGGGIMIIAQRRRIRILQIERASVFVPDVFANILIVATVPFAFYLYGKDILPALFLWNAALTYAIYTIPSANQNREEELYCKKGLNVLLQGLKRPVIQAGVLFFLVLPLFFQLDGVIFTSPEMIFDSRRQLDRLPLPVSVFACFAGIALHVRYKKAQISSGVLFSVFAAMALSVFVVSSGNDGNKEIKLIFMMQFILPLFALLLGQSYVKPENHKLQYESVFLYVLVLILPVEVLASLAQGTQVLTPYLYVFSIYQQLQYVPVIFVGLYFLAVFALYKHSDMQWLLFVIAPFLGVYAALSASTMVMLMVVFGTVGAAYLLPRKGFGRLAIVASVFSVVTMLGYMLANPEIAHVVSLNGPKNAEFMGTLLPTVRLSDVGIYLGGITEDWKTFLFGHSQRLDPNLLSGGYNYYLDLAYNYGVIATLPFLYLVGYTLVCLWRVWKAEDISPDMVGLAVIVLFYILIVNSLTVSFRQPYPGIVQFFLWGVLLNRLSSASPGDVKL